MMQELLMPLRLSSRFLSPAMASKSFYKAFNRQFHFKSIWIHQSKVLIPPVVTCDSRSFHSTHHSQTLHGPRWRRGSPTMLSQSPSQSQFSKDLQISPSAALHTLKGVKSNRLLGFPSDSMTTNCVTFDLLRQDLLSSYSQIRSLHKQGSSRRRISRTFSSRKDSTLGSSDSESKEEKDVTTTDDDIKKLSVFQRFKKAYKEHGKVLVVVHLMTSAVWLGSFYGAARCGVDIVPLLEKWNLSEKVISPFRSGGLGDLALAYLMYKLATPARYTVTLGGTNLALRYLKKEGKMQPVAEEDRLRELYKDGKADLKDRSTNTRRRFRFMRHRLQGRLRSARHRLQGRIRRARKRHRHHRRES